METIICKVGSTSLGNPGPAAIGVSITDAQGVVISEVSQTIGNSSTDFAEYNAVMVGLQTLLSLYVEATNTMEFELRLSNETVKKQLSAESTITNPGLVPMFIEIHNMRVTSFLNLTITQMSADENKEVNKLVMEALDGE